MKFDNQHTFFLTAGIGIITYSIPFIWNAYQEIISLKKKEVKNDIDGILKDETYSKSLLAFERIIQYPVGVLVFFLLVAIPFFSFGYGLIFLTLTFIYFLLMPVIFNEIIKKYSLTNKRLLELISKNKLDFKKNEKIFRELWDYGDTDLEKHFNTDFKTIFIVFSKEIDRLIESGYLKDKYVVGLLSDYEKYLSKRNIIYLVVYEEVFPKILEWHYEVWREEYNILGKNETETWGYYNEISEKLDEIIRTTLERSLAERYAFSFFDCLKKHVEKYKNEKIDEHSYLESLPIYQEFFKKLKKSSESYDIMNHYFPGDWKVSVENIKKRILISVIWLNGFMNWMRDRIDNPQDEYDDQINKAIGVLFPKVHTIYFPYILVFVVRSWMDNRRMESLIDNPPKFGGYYHYPLLDVSDKSEKDLDEERKKDWEMSKEYTIQLSILLFKANFKEIKKYIEELNVLELKYKNDDKKEYMRKELLDIFRKIDDEIYGN